MSNTHIVIVLDRSGSMCSCHAETIQGFDEFVNEQKLVKGNATLTLTQFDDEYEVVYSDKNIQNVPSIKDIYQPRGSTALLDAIGRTIKDTESQLVMRSKNNQPDRVLCVIITDGYENSSREWTNQTITQLIRDKEKDNWEFIFLSANLDAIAQASELGIKSGSAATYMKDNNKVWNKMSNKTALYRNATQNTIQDIKSNTCSMFDEKDRSELTSK